MMRFLAGVFDAEGYVSLSPGGSCTIGVNMCCETTISLFEGYFGGSKNLRKREHKKDVYTWNCLMKNQKRFITEIEKFSIVKREQLLLLREYLHLPRKERRANRKKVVAQIAACKIPEQASKESLDVETTERPNEEFFQWLAGFIEGDGSFCCWESRNQPTKKPRFSTSIEACNCHPEVIRYIKKRLEGSVGVNVQNKNPVWKWLCCPHNSLSVLARLYPHLIAKKEQCKLLMEFRTILASRKRKPMGRGSGKCVRGGWDNPLFQFTEEEASRMRAIICQIKLLHQ